MKIYTILLVDDDNLILKAMGDALESEGFAVTTAQSGEIALEMIDKQKYDIVITDLVMDLIDGNFILKKVKELHPETMVIILTGHGTIESAIRAVQLKADDYLLKPCDHTELTFRIQRCIQSIEKNKKITLYEDILPVCMYCKAIRDDRNTEPGAGSWSSMEEYLNNNSGINISHSCCPNCLERLQNEPPTD